MTARQVGQPPAFADVAGRALLGLGSLFVFGLVALLALHLVPVSAPRDQIWWLSTFALGLAMLAATLGSSFTAAGVMASILLVGGSAQLALTQPAWFQFVRLNNHGAFLNTMWAVFVVQAAVTALFLIRGGGIKATLAGVRALGVARVVLFLTLSISLSAGLMGHVAKGAYGQFILQLAVSTAFLIVNLAGVVALARALPAQSLGSLSARVASLISLPGHEGEGRLDRWWPWLVALFVLAVTILLALFAFQRVPGVPDEVAYLFQAQSFLHGHIALPAPPTDAAKALDYDWISIIDGQWFSIFPPGWPAALALGMAVGADWLVNPILAALAILAGHALAKRLASLGFANVAIALLAASPWFRAMGGSLMSHMLVLTAVLTAWWILTGARNSGPFKPLIAGALMGLVFLTRPVDGVILGILTGFWLMSVVDLRRPGGWLNLVAYGLGCLVIGGLIFPYNQALTGDFLITPIDQHFDLLWGKGSNRLGFGPDIGSPDGWGGLDIWRGHSPLEALIQAQFNLFATSRELFGWGVGSLVLVLAHLIWGRWNKLDLAMAALIVALIGGFSLYWFNGGFDIGARYWWMILPPLIGLSVRGALTLTERFTHLDPQASTRVGVTIAVLAAIGLTVFSPWRATTKYFEFRGFHTDYRRLAHQPALKGALVFVGGTSNDFGSAMIFNELAPSATKPLFVRDLGPDADAKVMAAFPGRPVVYVTGRVKDLKAHIVPASSWVQAP
ncbi:hypothetical protein BH11PSE2_BH11PSE2_09010 [soil metagenome]